MILGISILIWMGFFTLLSLIATGITGLLMMRLKKFSIIHRIFLGITMIFVLIHVTLVMLRWFWGISF